MIRAGPQNLTAQGRPWEELQFFRFPPALGENAPVYAWVAAHVCRSAGLIVDVDATPSTTGRAFSIARYTSTRVDVVSRHTVTLTYAVGPKFGRRVPSRLGTWRCTLAPHLHTHVGKFREPKR